MNPLFRIALAARASIVSPWRRVRLQRLATAGRAPVSVLFYHRVADAFPNAWTISRDQFRRHVDYCCQRMTSIDLAEVQHRVSSGNSPSSAVSFTFDDGYRDNCEFAIPLLIERGIPCTYFVVTDHVKSQRPFPHDAQRGQPLRVNSVEEIRQMSDAGIEIGCHTRTHVDFSRIESADEIRREIIDAKDELEQMIGKRVRYFAFPYGLPEQLTRQAIAAVQMAGFDGFCSAFGGYNLPGSDAFHIRRCHGDPEYSRFVNWLCFDESKIRKEPLVPYDVQTTPSESHSEPKPGAGSVPLTVAAPAFSSQATESCG